MQPGVLHPYILHAVSAKGMANPGVEWKGNANQGGALLKTFSYETCMASIAELNRHTPWPLNETGLYLREASI